MEPFMILVNLVLIITMIVVFPIWFKAMKLLFNKTFNRQEIPNGELKRAVFKILKIVLIAYGILVIMGAIETALGVKY